MLDPVTDLDRIPYTGGRGYNYVDRDTFLRLAELGQKYSLDELQPQNEYRLVRMVRDMNTHQVVYVTLDILVWDRNKVQMLFSHPTGHKTMILENYKKNWVFLKPEDYSN